MITAFTRRTAGAILLLLLLIIAAGPRPGRAADDWGHKLANTPTRFIFGYGSLIDTASRDATAGKPTPAIPVRVSAAFGYVRAWVDRCRCGFTALGLRRPHPGESAATINGVIYPVDGTDMTAFDGREQGYRRVAIQVGGAGQGSAGASRWNAGGGGTVRRAWIASSLRSSQ